MTAAAGSLVRLIVVLLAVLALAGCAGLSRKPGISGHPEIDGFELAGRIAVRYGSDGYTGTVRWRHASDRDLVELYTPVGTVYARLTRSATGAVMEMADGKRYEEDDAAALSRRILGWELPLAELPYWVFTRPAPGPAPERLETGQDGRPVLLEQAGWRMRYQAYIEGGSQVLPERFELDQPGLKVRMIVSRWSGPG